MTVVTIHAAKTNLSQLLARVEAGEEIIVARGKAPIAKLVPFTSPIVRRCFGAMAGHVSIGAEFFDPLPEEDLALWGQ